MWFSLPIEVIPAVDVLGEEAVRLHRGDYDAVVERAADPVALARRWVNAGARRVHLVDLDGARSGRVRPGLVRDVAAAVAPVPKLTTPELRKVSTRAMARAANTAPLPTPDRR